ncbi:hypothetical protein BGZ65_011448, partial [Modicella reniformis]
PKDHGYNACIQGIPRQTITPRSFYIPPHQEELKEKRSKHDEMSILNRSSHPSEMTTITIAVQDSLRNLQVDYIDLYLIHWPGTAKLKLSDPQNTINRAESWRALEDLYHAKKLRAIGVSNYTHKHLTKLIERPHHQQQHQQQPTTTTTTTTTTTSTMPHKHERARTRVVPHVHQFEMHPRLFQRDLLEFCQDHRIQVQAYSSLGEGRLVSLTKPPPPPMDPHYNNVPLPGTLDIMPDLIRKYFPPHPPTKRELGNSISNDCSIEQGMDINNTQDTWTSCSDIISSSMEGIIPTTISTNPIIIDNNNDAEISQSEYAKRSAQILLRWSLQHGAVVIPKSTHPERIRDNIDLFSFEIEAV